MVADVFHFYAGAVDKHHGETIPVAGGVDMTFREPLGVVGLIVPWNFPLNIASLEARPGARLRQHRRAQARRADAADGAAARRARAGGRASRGRRSTSLAARARSSAQRLVEHPDVAKIGFTGSTEVGRGGDGGRGGDDQARHARARRQVGQRRLRRRRPRSAAAAAAPYAVFDNAGQDCCARSRILVERSAYDRFARPARRGDARRAVGDPADDATEMGPLISAPHREQVASFVDDDVALPRRRAGRSRLLVSRHARRGDERRPDRARGGLRPRSPR